MCEMKQWKWCNVGRDSSKRINENENRNISNDNEIQWPNDV